MVGFIKIESDTIKGTLATANEEGFRVQRTMRLARVTIPFSDIQSYTLSERKEYDPELIGLCAFLGGLLFVANGMPWLGVILGASLGARRRLLAIKFILKDGRTMFGVMSQKTWKRVQAAISGNNNV